MKILLILLIDIYKVLFSGILKQLFGGGCRYTPTCSEYAKIVISRYGVIKGLPLALNRFVHCNPFVKNYCDPVLVK